MATFWIAFAVIVTAALAFDLGVMERRGRISVRASLWLTAGYIFLALLFGMAVWVWRGPDPAMAYFAAYLLEKSLSLDNIFVFLVIFQHFRVPAEHQHRVLFWGILGALVLRAMLIFAGIALIHRVHWVIYLFGALVIAGGLRLLFRGQHAPDPATNPLLKFLRRHVPLTDDYRDHHFFVHEQGHWLATPLFAVAVLVEATDLMFALDSIPAVFGISLDPFIVYTSNVFAILGLRALYFALAGVVERFRYLEYGLALLLVLIGVKMLMAPWIDIPVGVTLLVTGAVLGGTVAMSLIHCRRVPPGEGTC